MAKELPYFRFTVQEWQNGKISLESYELQGVFMSICGYYWLQDCCLSRTLLCKKFRGYENLVDELIELSILKFNKKTDEIEITFLNMQFDLLSKARQSKQKAGSIGGKQKSSNARAVLKQNPSYKDKDNDNDNNKDNNKEKDNVFQNSIEFLHPHDLEDNNQSLEVKKENTVLPGGRQKNDVDNRKLQFRDKLLPFMDEYGKDTLREFYNYWTEISDGGLKFRMEYEKVFEIKKRLVTWQKRNKMFNKDEPKQESRLSKNLSVLQSALQTLNEREQDGIQ
jgi:hypothetical protein